MHANQSVLHEVASELLTPRLLLRSPRQGDGPAVHEALVESLPDLRTWSASLPWVTQEPSMAASEVFCRETHAAFIQRTRLGYLAFDRESGQFVASIGLHTIDWKLPKFELGFWCRSSRVRQGYMREALLALMRHAHAELGARRLSCRTEEGNHACRGLCTSLGMVLEGINRNDRIAADGTLRNMCSYAWIPL